MSFHVFVVVPGDQRAVFDFFEDPRSLMLVPGVKNVRGEGGPGGVVVVESEEINQPKQHVTEFEPPHRTVVRASGTVDVWKASYAEENVYVQHSGGTQVSRTVTIWVEARMRRRMQRRLDPLLERFRQRHQQTLDTIAAAFAAQSGGL